MTYITITHHGRDFGQFDVWQCNDYPFRYVTKHREVGTQYAPDLATVYTSLIYDDGYSGYKRYCGALHMPSMRKTIYSILPLQRVDNHYTRPNPSLLQRKAWGDTRGWHTGIGGVSFDGSYAKRGYKSHYCLGIVIEVYTGWIVDFSVMSKCRLCKDPGLISGMSPRGTYWFLWQHGIDRLIWDWCHFVQREIPSRYMHKNE